MPTYLGNKDDTFAFDRFKQAGRGALGEQQRYALDRASRATGGELVGLPGFAAGSVGQGGLARLRRESLRRGASQIAGDFSMLGGQQAGREVDFVDSLLRARQAARIREEEEKRNRPTVGGAVGGVVGGLVSRAADRYLPF